MLPVRSDATDGIFCDDYAGAGRVIYLGTASDLVALSKKVKGFKIPYSYQIRYVTFVNITGVLW
jgi:hypothetical protein